MRWLVGGTLVIASFGCAEVRIDPARGQREPVVESYDAMIDEDAATPAAPEAPPPEWASDPPPPAFPPPPLD